MQSARGAWSGELRCRLYSMAGDDAQWHCDRSVYFAHVCLNSICALGYGLPVQLSSDSYQRRSLSGCHYGVRKQPAANAVGLVRGYERAHSASLIAHWMIGCYFMAIKRYSELAEIDDRSVAGAYRASFKYYTPQSLLVSIVF